MDGKIAIAWADLSYNVKPYIFGAQKTILNRLYGSLDFGEMIALMGSSGAGKTTLLKCLNGKLRSGLDQRSRIYLSCEHKIRPCFVGQHESEHLVMCLTAKQNLIYASKLKNSDNKSIPDHFSHDNNVMTVLNELMIGDICDTRVDRCSGGEQRRLTIAIEMTKIIKPNLLCIDEPTTGLDSNAAQTVMECLVKLCKTHSIAIITSIHQPNSEIVMSFDRLYVLAKGGNCVFDGHPEHIDHYLNQSNIVCNEQQVPIEELLKLSSIENPDQYIGELITKTRESQRLSVLMNCENKTKLSPKGIEFRSKSFKPIDMWYIMVRTMHYSYITQWTVIFSQFIFYILFATLTASTFDEDLGKPDACFNPQILVNTTCLKELEDDSLLFQNQNYVYFTTIMALFIHLCATTVTYLTDVKIFINEHQNRWYSTGSFFWAKNIVELFPTLLYAISYGFLSYYMSGQLFEQKRVIPYVVLIVLAFMCTEGIAHNIGITLVNYESIAIMLSISFFSSMSMFCNYVINVKDLPLVFQYISELAYLKYTFNSALLLIYGQGRCQTDDMSIILIKYSISDEDLWPNYYKFVLFLVSLRLLAYFMLLLKTNISFGLKSSKVLNTIQSNDNSSDDSVVVNIDNNKRRLSAIIAETQTQFNNNDIKQNNNQLIDDKLKNQISIAWTELSLKIPKTFFSEEKTILRQINGFFEFGTLNALMGCSGAGKTSLLKAINGLYSEYLSDETDILLNRCQKIKTCFIVQNEREHILTGLTAKQALIYASKLKNSDKDFDHSLNVSVLMSELLISNTVDTNVEKCSGGEQKRLVIAMELTSGIKPNLLCIDEPTSGLDSNAAQVVMHCLKRLSSVHNICVITSIHQPNNDILVLFDRLYVLSKGGQCVYAGPPQQLTSHLTDCGIDCTEKQLPIEVLLRYSCNGLNDANVQKMVSKTTTAEKEVINKRSKAETLVFPDGVQHLSKRFFLRDLRLLLFRNITYTYRYYWKFLLFQTIVYFTFGLSLQQFFSADIGQPSGCVNFEDDYNNTCAKTELKLAEEKLIDQNIKYNFFTLCIVLFFTSISTTLTFTSDLKMFFNEQRNFWYSTGAYYWSKAIVELIPTVIIILIYSYIVDIYSAQNSMFFGYFVYITAGALQIQSIGHCIGIILSDSQHKAVFATVGVFIGFFLFSNFLIPVNDLHYAIKEFSNLSPVKLVLENVLILFYGFDRCTDREFSTVLYMFNTENIDFFRNTRLLIVQFFLFRSLSLIALLLKVNPIVNSKKAQAVRQRAIQTLMLYHPRNNIPGLNSHHEYLVKSSYR